MEIVVLKIIVMPVVYRERTRLLSIRQRQSVEFSDHCRSVVSSFAIESDCVRERCVECTLGKFAAVNMNVPPQLLHQLPLLAIFVVPVTSAYFGLTRINMKSAIHFQQRILSTLFSGNQRFFSMASCAYDEHVDDPIICVLVRFSSSHMFKMCPGYLILLDFLKCLLLRGPSALAYQLGFSLAIVVVFCSVASILHYVPSPSLFAYPQLRFQSSNCEFNIVTSPHFQKYKKFLLNLLFRLNFDEFQIFNDFFQTTILYLQYAHVNCYSTFVTVRFALSILQTVVTFLCILLVLLHSSSMLASVSLFSLYLCVALVAFFPLFAVVFSGYSSIMTLSLVLHTFCILFGIGVFLVFGIKDVTSFRTIVPYEFTMSDAVLSLFVGFIVSLYQLTSSPLLYQAYFPIPTLYKLRLTLVFHGVFQLFSSILVFLTISLFYAFLEKKCSLSFSYQTLFQFAKYTVPHPALAYAVIVSFLSVFTFCIQWLYMCITTHVWEEFVKVHLRDLGSMKQLCCLQTKRKKDSMSVPVNFSSKITIPVNFTAHMCDFCKYSICDSFFPNSLRYLDSFTDVVHSVRQFVLECAEFSCAVIFYRSVIQEVCLFLDVTVWFCSSAVHAIVALNFFSLEFEVKFRNHETSTYITIIFSYNFKYSKDNRTNAFPTSIYFFFSGALTSLIITTISSLCLFYLYASHNTLPTLKSSCSAETVTNSTVLIRSFNMEKMVLMASQMPLYSHPIVAFVMSVVICPIVSFFTGGQDQMSLDWNLLVVPGSLGRGSAYSKRPFVESESFRYAQHTAGPGLLKHQR
ncbi:hypothetical protein NECAME_04886 [Necator americanus]|uniref:Uncharacterized protein n=1 Tax=Necator americanus TaxID=51031 RepID=W2SLP3_NECAM|nr:hypothetical protein NECAME_04886 [Necator americanus]ETN70463.1 hypothetical protein NECAME_04886 [Necator americanus]